MNEVFAIIMVSGLIMLLLAFAVGSIYLMWEGFVDAIQYFREKGGAK